MYILETQVLKRGPPLHHPLQSSLSSALSGPASEAEERGPLYPVPLVPLPTAAEAGHCLEKRTPGVTFLTEDKKNSQGISLEAGWKARAPL